MTQRDFTPADRLLICFDQAMRTLFGRPQVTERRDPAGDYPEAELNDHEKDLTGRLMRINHTGEVCAQALYQGQALTARLPRVRERMERAALEENDHLDWCETRIHELGGRTSLLNPLWYAGSFAIGAAAGIAGDRWSLGFVAETERQVEAHLDGHIDDVPARDRKTHAILEQMKADEIAHADQAMAAGGASLPGPVSTAMKVLAKLITTSVYRL